MADADVSTIENSDYSSKVLRASYTHPSQLIEEAELHEQSDNDISRRIASALRAEAKRWETELL